MKFHGVPLATVRQDMLDLSKVLARVPADRLSDFSFSPKSWNEYRRFISTTAKDLFRSPVSDIPQFVERLDCYSLRELLAFTEPVVCYMAQTDPKFDALHASIACWGGFDAIALDEDDQEKLGGMWKTFEQLTGKDSDTLPKPRKFGWWIIENPGFAEDMTRAVTPADQRYMNAIEASSHPLADYDHPGLVIAVVRGMDGSELRKMDAVRTYCQMVFGEVSTIGVLATTEGAKAMQDILSPTRAKLIPLRGMGKDVPTLH